MVLLEFFRLSRNRPGLFLLHEKGWPKGPRALCQSCERTMAPMGSSSIPQKPPRRHPA